MLIPTTLHGSTSFFGPVYRRCGNAAGKAITEYRFAYSSRNTGMVPPPGTVSLNDFTPKVAELFETAFSPVTLESAQLRQRGCKLLVNLNPLYEFVATTNCIAMLETPRPVHGAEWKTSMAAHYFGYGPHQHSGSEWSPRPSVRICAGHLGVPLRSERRQHPSSISIPIPPVHTALKPTQAANEARWKRGLIHCIGSAVLES